MGISILLVVVSSFCLTGQILAVELESPVDVRYVSQLRVELRSLPEPDRCRLLWEGIENKLEDKSSLDVVVLARLGQFLKTKMAYKMLAQFVDDCVVALSVKYKTLEAISAKKKTEADANDDIGILLQDIETLQTQLSSQVEPLLKDIDNLHSQLTEKDRQLALLSSRKDVLPGQVEQLTREKDEALREVNDLKLELEAAKKTACYADASGAKLMNAIKELHRSSEMAVQQMKNEPTVKGYESGQRNHKLEQPYESIPNPYATIAAPAAAYNWPAQMHKDNIGSVPNQQASFASAYASASG